MEPQAHYLTYAVFFAKDKKYGEVPYCNVDYGALEGEAIIRKVCFCGADVSYDQDQMIWICSMSGEAVCSELEDSTFVGRSYSEPLISMKISPNLYASELGHPEKDSHLALDEANTIHVFMKIPKKKIWMISDPLPIGNYFVTSHLGSDLFVEWKIEIAYDLPGSISVSVPLSVFDEQEKSYLGTLASGSAAYLHFLDKESLSVIAHRRLIPNQTWNYSVIQKALQLADRLPANPEEREAALRDLEEEHNWSMVETACKLGLPECTEFLRFFLGKGGGENLLSHVANCQHCQKFFPPAK